MIPVPSVHVAPHPHPPYLGSVGFVSVGTQLLPLLVLQGHHPSREVVGRRLPVSTCLGVSSPGPGRVGWEWVGGVDKRPRKWFRRWFKTSYFFSYLSSFGSGYRGDCRESLSLT